MLLYIHPMSTTSRPVMLFAAEAGIPHERRVIDLFAGEHMGEAFRAINPSCLVPVLEDGDFRLTESSAILKYLAEKAGRPEYPQELRARARVNELMDWFNANLYRSFGYGLVYPQVLPMHKRRSAEGQAATLERAKTESETWLRVLDEALLGPNKRYVCGAEITLADYLGAAFIDVGDVIGCDFAPYPNVRRWLSDMRTLQHWPETFGPFEGWAASQRGQDFVRL